MKRFVFGIVVALSVVLLVASCTLWGLGQLVAQQWLFANGSNVHDFSFNRRGVALASFGGVPKAIPTYHVSMPASDVFLSLRSFPTQTRSRLGFQYVYVDDPAISQFRTLRAVAIPYWALVLVCACPVWVWVRRRRVRT